MEDISVASRERSLEDGATASGEELQLFQNKLDKASNSFCQCLDFIFFTP